MHPSFAAFNIVCCISLSKIKKMNFAQGRHAKNAFKIKELNSYRLGIMGLNQGTLLVIKIPDSRVLRIISRSLFFALFLLTLPSIGSDLRGCFYNNAKSDVSFDPAILNLVKMLFPDFVDEGLVKRGHKGLVVGYSVDNMLKEIDLLSENGIDLIVESNLDENKLIPNESLDFVIGLNFKNTKPVDRVLKTGGIVITQLNNEPLGLVQRLPNYRIVFLRRFQNTVVAMRKVGLKDQSLVDDDPSNDLIPPCGISQEARKMALTGLEDALLEPPPRRALKSKDGSRKMKFLPNLLGDSLSSYPRRIFVSDEKNGVDDWFHNNYPARNQYFEVYNLEPMATNGVVSEWLRNNVRQEDFVVMKAEAQIVEEMMKDKAMCLVDELFLECKNQWQEEESKRAYWQCLTLYGSLRDQGVAVHQWWS